MLRFCLEHQFAGCECNLGVFIVYEFTNSLKCFAVESFQLKSVEFSINFNGFR